jgi:thiamine-phosphate pyrophosphorylase
VGEKLLVGVSTHSAAEIAEAEGADFAVCGPVFDTPSKRGMGEPLGVERLSAFAAAAPFPILAIGGIDRATAATALAAPIAGLAAIRLFHDAWRDGGRDRLRRLVDELRTAR